MLIAAVLRSAAEGNAERRAYRRHNIRLDACVDFDGQPIPFPCVIVDVSSSGAQLFVRLPAGVDEMKLAGLTPAPCRHVAPPRVAESPVALECRLSQEVQIGDTENAYFIAVLEVVAFHVRDDLYDDGRIDPRRLGPLSRLGGNAYAHPGEVFEMERPPATRPY